MQRLRRIADHRDARRRRVARDLERQRKRTPREALGGPAMLARYRAARRVDRRAGIAFTHGLTQLFASDAPAVRIPRGLGMMLLDSVPVAKRAFTRAMLYGPRW
jgi:2-polyprenyl-6-methoxyphenol hydroxylase-like FAD-dependent oxidoreductase